MIARCNDTESSLYTNYGGRGIAVCDRWRDSFENFLADMGQRPSRDLSIDRINNDGNYEPGNCRWATRTQQSRNQRSNRHITVGDRTMLLVEWSEATGLSMPTIAGRLKRGWSPQRAISTPVRTKGPRK